MPRWIGPMLPPPPMPQIRGALIYMEDARAAVERGTKAWNASQVTDAIASARTFLRRAERAIAKAKRQKSA